MVLIFCDGASNPHTKRAGIGVVWFLEEHFSDPNDPTTLIRGSKPIKTISEEIPYTTNNVAEYKSLIRALEENSNFKDTPRIFMDSKLVVNQVLGLWKINYPHLQELRDDVIKMENKFSLQYVPRKYNTHADKASKDCFV